MMNTFDPSDMFSIFDVLDGNAEAQPQPIFDDALSAAIRFIENGAIDWADAIGRVLIAPGRVHDARAAYKWFYIGLSQRGYTTTYNNEYEKEGTYYLGPAGDFRNESDVSACIEELGLAALHALDAEAEKWLRARGLSSQAIGTA